MADYRGGILRDRLSEFGLTRRFALTSRILAVNILPLLLLGGGIFYIDNYRKQLLSERYKLARIEAQITAEALAGASRERQEALLIQIGKEQKMRLRMYDAEGNEWADSFELDGPAFVFGDPDADGWGDNFARLLDSIVDAVVNAEPIPPYLEPESERADAFPVLARAREEGVTQIELAQAPDRTPVITAAAPVGLQGSTLLTTRNAIDITESVRSARQTLLIGVVLALMISIFLSLYLARTIVTPLQLLARAAFRVRAGREREVEVPRLPDRNDEIGLLARAISDMTHTLRQRIDSTEHFAADVAHEIKNPLASLRSAIESLVRVEDPELRGKLTDIAAHDVRRIDRLVTEISDASRIDAEMTRTAFEEVDLADLLINIIGTRESRAENEGRTIAFERPMLRAVVAGVPVRLERVIENLLDNAVSFSPPDGVVTVTIDHPDECVRLTVCDEGPGVAQDAREKVFQRFHSDRPESEDFGNHSGLGLAIARTIAEAHDGSLTVHSRADQRSGACFELHLPDAMSTAA
ncbi:Histidine kinase [Alteripontixanthobacter maritimus]|uniref:histidine kinase n=1 Tax=Alteripontixanthobacter maritimus TaxID=2161824 RepID=A0A369QAK8_9SPHN|nr:HAMP domain-containing sensor histidine kinase [Alteripontixanthobacter maritimus]RDC60565.1 Histidine kinase [Alteripontixanthobacter maritimus]